MIKRADCAILYTMKNDLRYKMIVSDFDGTLLRSDNTVSQATRDSIAAYIRAGGIFTISTGRNYLSIKRRLPEVGLEALPIPVMSLQGGLVVDNRTGEELFAEFLPTDAVLRFLALCERDGKYCHVYGKYDIFCETACTFAAEYERLTTIPVQPVGDLKRFAAGRTDWMKCLAVCDPAETVQTAEQWAKEMQGLAQIVVSSARFVECVPLNGGKGAGVCRTAECLGIDIKDVIAVGDEINDVSMIQAAGLGVAMGNARAAVKEIADYVTDVNDEDGVRKLIERFCPEVK